MIAVVAVFGIAWMADTVFESHLPEFKAALSELVQTQPWTYAIALLLVSKLVNSQAAAIQFDRSGTTRIGKYVINHSFIIPGLIGVATSCLMGYLLASASGLI